MNLKKTFGHSVIILILSFFSTHSFALCSLTNNGFIDGEPIPIGCTIHSFQAEGVGSASATMSSDPKCNYNASEKCSRVLKCAVQKRDYCNKTVYNPDGSRLQSANINLVCQDGYQYRIDKNGTKDICQIFSKPLKSIHILEYSQPRDPQDIPTY